MRNIVIAGFMGSGKTSIGRALAKRLDMPFVDTDALIEERTDMKVDEIFRERGERFFREMEADLVRELASDEGKVIATGGGMVVPEENWQLLLGTGVGIVLFAPIDITLEWIGQTRPLLRGDLEEQKRKAIDLLASRAASYAQFRFMVDTDRDETEVVEEIEAYVKGKPWEHVIPVASPDGGYDIRIRKGLLDEVGDRLRAIGLDSSVVAVVSNTTVAPLYAERVMESLSNAGYKPILTEIPDGEEYKNLETVRMLYDRFLEAGMDRHSVVLALGGGVTGDIAGFAAATYMRGVPFVQVPTTLLAMVDASVGGKTGVDLPQGKNLVGAFKQPKAVLIDPSVLETLPGEYFRAGLAEVLKHGLIANPILFEMLAGPGPASLEQMLANAIRVKVRIVQDDPFESGKRAWLNLGHTFAHAWERLSGYELQHGEAVAMGLVAAARLSERLGIARSPISGRITNALERLGLPSEIPDFLPNDVLAAMQSDKKRKGGKLRFVLLRQIGEPVVQQVGESEVLGSLVVE
jgi:shikimate kinase/3-dehydroquinate synthase